MTAARTSVRVAAPPDVAFEVFTTGIGRWWPLHAGFAYAGERAQEIFLEPRTGGRFYERLVDGDELQVGTVIACDPPRRILFSWRAPDWDAATEVEVTFTAEGGATRVDLEHRGFERLGPAGEARGREFGGGWVTVLGAFVAHVGDHESS